MFHSFALLSVWQRVKNDDLLSVHRLIDLVLLIAQLLLWYCILLDTLQMYLQGFLHKVSAACMQIVHFLKICHGILLRGNV